MYSISLYIMSMQNYAPDENRGGEQLGGSSFMDLTDRENDEFVYIYWT